MDEEILLIVIMEIMVVMIGVAVKLYLLTNQAMRIVEDEKQLIEEGYLQRPDNK